MSSNDIICRVYALYPYSSTDASSLSFEQGDIIEVLAQLESGWWDGWCNGKRGWFPSNYVQVIDERPSNDYNAPMDKSTALCSHEGPMDASWSTDRIAVQDQKQRPSLSTEYDQHHLRLSLAASDMLFTKTDAHPKTQSSNKEQSNWILQTTEDGSEVYYYNVITKEMRYSAPYEESKYKFTNDFSREAADHGQLNYEYNSNNGFDDRPVRPSRAVNRINHGHRPIDDQSLASAGTATSSSNSSPSIFTSRSMNDDQLPPNWIRKTTPKGREYFCNVVTEETVWTLDHVDPQTGLLFSPASSQQSAGGEFRLSMATMGGKGNTDDPPRSWKQLLSLVSHAVENLKGSAKHGQAGLIQKDALKVAHHIRLLLYVSNSVDKESSPYLKTSKQLKAYHRALLAALAKLVLSAKVASGAWAPAEAIHKLQLDADEVLTAAKNFLSVAQEMRIEVHDSKPRLLLDGSSSFRWRGNSNMRGTRPDAITTLSVLADTVNGAISSFMDSARDALSLTDDAAVLAKIKSSTPLLVAQFRNLSNTTSQFLDSIDDVGVTQPTDTDRFAGPRQAIYNAMGSLFIASQGITDQSIVTEEILATFERIEICANILQTNIQEICAISRQLATEHSADNNPLTTAGDAGRRPSLDITRSTPLPCPSRLDDIHEEEGCFVGSHDMEADGTERGNVLSDETGAQPRQQQPKDKLAKFFGEDTLAAARRRDTLLGSADAYTPDYSPGTAGPKPQTAERSDYLGSDYNPNEIVFNMEGNVKGGTVTALVQRLTQHDQLDSKFNTTFLLTYRSFCTTEELFEALFKRYTLLPPPDLTQEELEIWREKKLKLVRLRVFNVIKSWLEHYYNEEEDRHILPIVMEFTDTVIRESIQFGADQLLKLIRKRMDAEDSQIRKMTLNVRESDMPQPILPKNMKRLRFLDIDPLELARQLTIMDFKLYSRIKPVECLDKNWGKSDSESIAANVKASIEYSNQVTAWVTDSILSKDEVKKRAAVVKHWILVAERCRQLNNYNTCMAILSAFDNSSIGRLKRTWELMSARITQTLASIRRLMGANKNFNEYREIIHKVNPPCIPFLGIYLQDLTFIEDGNSNFLKKSSHLINFAKRMKTAEVIRELQQYQSTPYLLQAVPDIQEFIKTHLQSSRDEETLYNMSLALEPRERDEDTIARRLKESGL